MTVKNRRVFELRLGKVGLLVFIGGMSVLLFSLFLLGVVVGKHMEAYPERYASGITEVIRDRFLAFGAKRQEAPSRAADEEAQESAGGGADFGLTFYDTLGGKRGTAGEAATGRVKHKASGGAADQASAAGAAPETAPQPPGQGALLSDPVPDPAAGGTEGAKSIPPARVQAEGEAPTPPAGESVNSEKRQFEIQMAAYREKSQAERMAKRIAAMGFAPRVMVKDLPGRGRWFRVIVGGFANRQAAQEAAERITGKIEGLKSVIRASTREGNGR